jgi:hypothetical protein
MLNPSKKTYGKHYAMGTLIAALGAGSYVIAAVTFSDFTSGTIISAAEMNAKLNALKDAVNTAEASATCPANTPARFTVRDNGATVCDSQTGLMWEIKTGIAGTPVPCSTLTDCPDPNNVNNRYTWTSNSTEPNGTLYTNFLERLNDLKTANDGNETPCFGGHCDWRIPTIGELRSILQAPYPDCRANPCIAAGFPGPVQQSYYWSSSSYARYLANAWNVSFSIGDVLIGDKFFDNPVRAVRGGR